MTTALPLWAGGAVLCAVHAARAYRHRFTARSEIASAASMTIILTACAATASLAYILAVTAWALATVTGLLEAPAHTGRGTP